MAEAGAALPLVETLVEDAGWLDLLPEFEAVAEGAARAALSAAGLDPAGYGISLLACDDSRIAALNAEFRGKPVPTNVLSWPATDLSADEPGGDPWLPAEPEGEEPDSLGDIAIARETVAREALAAQKPVAGHVTHLILHATLHLLGYDHDTEADAGLMEGIESRTLVSMGFSDPYSDPGAPEASIAGEDT